MTTVSKVISFVFHPIFFPYVGALVYFRLTPRHFSVLYVEGKLYSLALISIAIPLIGFFLLAMLEKITSIFLTEVNERKLPIALYCLAIILIVKNIFPIGDELILYYFFLAIFTSLLIAWALSVIRVKVSLHLLGLGGLLSFVLSLSQFYKTDLTLHIGLIFLLSGAVATARWHLRAHNRNELIAGYLIGLLPQLVGETYWV